MATFTEIVAVVAVHSSAAALSHFGVTLTPAAAPVAPVERVVTRTPRPPAKLADGVRVQPRALLAHA
jgi:hypothetical protein